MASSAKSTKKVAVAVPPVIAPAATTTFDFDKWFPFILAAIALLLYANTLTHQYVLDDDTVMAKNSIVKKGISAIPEIMTTPYRKGAWLRQESLYRPLSLVMFAIEWQIAPNQPALGHFINILLYALTGFLLYKLLRKWFPQKHSFILFCIGLLFMVHPLHTEVIANIKSRDEVLGFLFALLAFSAIHDYVKDEKKAHLFYGILCYFLALLSKESTLTLLAVIPLSVYFFTDEKGKKKYLWIVAGLIISTALYFILRYIALKGMITFNKVDVLNNSIVATDSGMDRFATAIVIIGYYILLFFYPHPLSFDYSLNTIPVATVSDIRFILSILVLLLLIAYSIWQLKKKNPIAFGILLFGITLSIVCNIVVLIEATLAERFMYLPSLGLCIAVVLLLEKLTSYSANANDALQSIFNKNKIFSVLLIVVACAFSIKSFMRNFDWKDNFTLFSVDKDHNPKSYRNLSAYASELYNQKITPIKEETPERAAYCREAEEYLIQSLAITPDNFSSWNLLMYCQTQLQQFAQAVPTFEAGIQYHKTEPDLDKFYVMGVNAYFLTHNFTKALETAKKGCSLFPNNSGMWNCVGMIQIETNEKTEALNALQKAIALDSLNADAYYNLGNLYARNSDFNMAIETYQKSLKHAIAITRINVLNNMGNSYAALKQYDKALEYYLQIISIQPNHKDALKNIFITYSNMGNTAKAQEYQSKMQALP